MGDTGLHIKCLFSSDSFFATDVNRPLSTGVVAQLILDTTLESSVLQNDLFNDDFSFCLAFWEELSKLELFLIIDFKLKRADNKGKIFSDKSSILQGTVKLSERVIHKLADRNWATRTFLENLQLFCFRPILLFWHHLRRMCIHHVSPGLSSFVQLVIPIQWKFLRYQQGMYPYIGQAPSSERTILFSILQRLLFRVHRNRSHLYLYYMRKKIRTWL